MAELEIYKHILMRIAERLEKSAELLHTDAVQLDASAKATAKAVKYTMAEHWRGRAIDALRAESMIREEILRIREVLL
jgi:hypothetical protein